MVQLEIASHDVGTQWKRCFVFNEDFIQIVGWSINSGPNIFLTSWTLQLSQLQLSKNTQSQLVLTPKKNDCF